MAKPSASMPIGVDRLNCVAGRARYASPNATASRLFCEVLPGEVHGEDSAHDRESLRRDQDDGVRPDPPKRNEQCEERIEMEAEA